MASSYAIHEDQENRPNLRQKRNAMAAPPKRSVLGLIQDNVVVPVAAPAQNKKQTFNKDDKKLTKTQLANINNRKLAASAPIVPVAQFEAFKVYEDDDLVVNNNKENDDEAAVAVDVLQNLQKNARSQQQQDELLDEAPSVIIIDASPMSIEKSATLNDKNVQLAQAIILKNSNNGKDIFFEVEEYRDDIYAYLREQELRHRPKAGYILKQPDVNESMRAILVNWLVEVSEEYKLHTETLYLAVNFIDRFLSYMSVVRAKLQLVGTAAMFLASKYEEIFPPDVNEFVYITDDTYSKHQVIRMEHLMLKVLGFDLSIPTPLTFINAMCISAKLTEKTMYLAMYLSELSLLEVGLYLSYLPSVLAASSIALARHSLGEEPWSSNLYTVTGYKLVQLRDCVSCLYKVFAKAPESAHSAIPEKYKSGKYFHVSQIEPRNELDEFE